VVGTTDHLPFGEEIGVSGEEVKHNFTTYERDGTGLHYAVNRHYNPKRGRFNQADPFGIGASRLAEPQSLNLYAYCANDPVNHIDPSGRYSFYAFYAEAEAHYGGGGGGGFPFGIDISFWGERIADLPGFGTQWGSFSALAEAKYLQGVQDAWDAARATRLINSEDPEEQARGWEIVDSNPNLEVQGKPPTSINVLDKTLGITYEDGLSNADKIKAGNAISGGASLINQNEHLLSDDDKKAIGQITAVSVVKPGGTNGVIGTTMHLSITYIKDSSEAWLGSLFAHEGQHILNRGNYSDENRWKNEQSAGQTQLSAGILLGLSPHDITRLQRWISDDNKAKLQEHMEKGLKY
jgi:RHS repeat-associated protein